MRKGGAEGEYVISEKIRRATDGRAYFSERNSLFFLASYNFPRRKARPAKAVTTDAKILIERNKFVQLGDS